jgi:hypothetical protein
VVAIVSIETVLLVLLIVLVAALLRSHAEILRRLGPEEAATLGVPAPPPHIRTDIGAPELAGATPTGDAVQLSLAGDPTLLAFLSSGCTSCTAFFEALGHRRLRPELQTVIVTRGSDREQPAKLRRLVGDRAPVIMSSHAWEDYAVPGTPYFVLIEEGMVRGEGVATTWDALASLVGEAIDEQRGIEERLAAAGIGADHPSLYPGGRG